MLYTPHFLTGAAIARIFPNPYLYIPTSIASHIALDLTPHNDLEIEPGITLKKLFQLPLKRKLLIFGVVGGDLLLMIGIAIWLWSATHSPALLFGGFAGILPDAAEQGLMVFGRELPGWFNKLQWRVSARYGFLSYPIVSALALYIIFHYSQAPR